MNHCFVLDHEDASITVHIPTLRGKLHIGYVVCQGSEQIRQPGFYTYWQAALHKGHTEKTAVCSTEDIPF
ncbi:MAG: hypothetical protein GY805_36635 [Chloroflexi bacterium]|nr:hypothetical protein [Chloroflexota bacterium]